MKKNIYKTNPSLFVLFSLNKAYIKGLCVWILEVSQETVIIVKKLVIGAHSVGSCLVGPISHKSLALTIRGKKSPNIKQKVNCTKWNLGLQLMDMVQLVVIIALLDEIVLQHKVLVQQTS